jgi:hypothetical protein
MGIPTLELADLLALRDGEETRMGVEIALNADWAARRRLLEHRLLALALAFTMPRPSEEIQRPRALPTDPSILERYVMGTLSAGALAAYEASVQGNPARFADLIDFKNAFFGRSKFVSSHRVPEPPRPDRDELGVLALRAIDGQTFLTWRPASESGLHVEFLRAADTVTPYQGSSEALESLLAVEARLRDLQYELNYRLEILRAQILMAMQARDLPPLLKLRDAMGEAIQEQDRLTQRLRKLREQVAEALSRRTVERLEEEEGGPWSRGYEIETRLARLDFMIDGHGLLQLRIAAAKAQAEFTWIRPGVSFESLQPERGARQPLGRIDRDEALLLISASGERSQVVRVRQD